MALWYDPKEFAKALVHMPEEEKRKQLNPEDGTPHPMGILISLYQLEGVRLLLEHGTDPNRLLSDLEIPPLQVAVRKNFANCVSLLLEYGADPTIPIYGGKGNLLELCCQTGSNEPLKILLSKLPLAEWKKKYPRIDENLIGDCILRKHKQCAQMLLDAGATKPPVAYSNLQEQWWNQMVSHFSGVRKTALTFLGILRFRKGVYKDIRFMMNQLLWSLRWHNFSIE